MVNGDGLAVKLEVLDLEAKRLVWPMRLVIGDGVFLLYARLRTQGYIKLNQGNEKEGDIKWL